MCIFLLPAKSQPQISKNGHEAFTCSYSKLLQGIICIRDIAIFKFLCLLVLELPRKAFLPLKSAKSECPP
jgi:hypothetical protein